MSQENDRSAVRERLGKLFSAPFEQHGDRWGVLWRQGDLPFDKGAPNPALTDTLLGKEDLVGKPVAVDDTGALRRRRALVPGCGRGYDVLWLASVGYEAYGLEVSSEAIRACEEFAATNFDIYARSATSEKGPGPFKFILGNFFRADWEAQLGTAYQGFDLIYDYTFLSALPPESRPGWSARMAELLNPSQTSRLICVEFPTYKDPATGGPPYGLPSEVYMAHLTRPGEELIYEEGLPRKDDYSERNSRGLQRIGHWQPERTHPIGKGTDWVSVWRPA